MKHLSILAVAALLAFTSCGDMDNNVNEEHSHADSMFHSQEQGQINPNQSTAPLGDSFGTDHMSPTTGPDNAAPKSTAQDSTPSTRQRLPEQR